MRILMVATVFCCSWIGQAVAQGDAGRVTLMAGSPRMVGEGIRPLQAILSGQQLETGAGDAAGLLVEDIVFHIGINTNVIVTDEPGLKRVTLAEGYVVFYTDAQTRSQIVVETPFGLLSFAPGSLGEDGSGWYSVRHDPEQVNVSAAVSTFATIEGIAEVEGTAPLAGPHTLNAGQRWRIVGGQVPGPPVAGDERGDAQELRQLLHRQAAEIIRVQTADVTRLASTDVTRVSSTTPFQVVSPTRQAVVDSNSAVQARPAPGLQPTPNVLPPPPEVEGPRFAIGGPVVVPAGTPQFATGDFVSYPGTPANPDFNDFLTSVNGNPAFQPDYFTDLANGGFSYIQLAGTDFQVTTSGGETFLATEGDVAAGWALFTPLIAIGDAEFDTQSALAAVVTDGFRAVALGEHLSGGGSIGGPAGDGYAVVSGNNVTLNPNLPAGYPQLDQAADTTGLTVDGQAVNDQIAALGAGRNPQLLQELGPQLVFISDSDTDALGNSFNFDGDAIVPSDLNLPGDRQVQVDNTGAAAQATPLTANEENTVGIQFAASGDTVAIIHHTGLGAGEDDPEPQSEHFEVVRGRRESVVQWRDGERVAGADGQILELEDLNEDPELRNELFAVLGEEVNNLVPPERHTVAGPAITQPGSAALRPLSRQPGRLIRVGDVVSRRIGTRRSLLSGSTRAARIPALKSAGGRLIRDARPASTRRHLGRVTPRN